MGLVMTNLEVVAILTAKPGSEKLVRETLSALIEPTRVEKGCISYQVFVSAVDPATFITVETWNSQEEFDAHLQTPYVQHAFETAGDHLTQAPAIHPLSPVNAR
jgi:quinol monooxygenase YgiN